MVGDCMGDVWGCYGAFTWDTVGRFGLEGGFLGLWLWLGILMVF